MVSETHKSSDFIKFLKILDKKYPLQDTIRIILDNHSAHTSKETQRFLDTMPKGRFKFVPYSVKLTIVLHPVFSAIIPAGN